MVKLLYALFTQMILSHCKVHVYTQLDHITEVHTIMSSPG